MVDRLLNEFEVNPSFNDREHIMKVSVSEDCI